MKKLNNPTENFVSRRINQRRVRRWVALLSALVLFLTVNTLKLEADTLERVATCGIEQHVHDESCYDASGALICGLAEHAHTDACFQQRPQRHDLTRVDGFMPLNAKVTLATPMPKLTSNSADGQDAVQAEADYYSDIPTEVGSGIEPPVDEIETELAGEDAAPAVEDAVPLEIVYEDQAEETVQQPEYVINGSAVLLSDILSALGMKASGIQTVGELEGDTFAEDPVNFAVEATQNDYELRVLRDFDAAELGVVTADEVIVITLKNGIAPVEDSDDENPSENDDINIEETHTEETDEEAAADETVDEEAEDSADELTENADDEETGEASDEATVDETEEEAVETVEETETAAVVPEKQIALDFADYDCLADATVYFYAPDRGAVLVNAEELAEADGVHLTVNAPVVLSMEADLGLAELEAALEEAPEDIDARIGENPVLFENGVLIISGDGELTVNGVTYTVTNLTLPARSVESDNITISTVDDQATLLGVTPAFEDNGEDEGDIYALFAASMDEHIVTATSEEIQIDAIEPAKGLLRSSAMMATTDAAPEAEEAVADAEETAGTETTEAAVETRTLKVRVYDVSLIREGESVEPDVPIHVETTFDAPLEGENFQLYHIVDGKPEEVDGFVKTDDQGRAIGMSFDTASLSPFAVVYYTVEYTTDNNEVTVKLDFTDIVKNGVDFDTNSVITALNDGVAVRIDELEQGYIEGTDSVVNGELYIDYTTADNKNENIKNVNWIGFEAVSVDEGLTVADGKIKVTKDGTVVLSDGISTVTVVISNYEKLVAKELSASGVDITVMNGEVPAGSEAQFTALDEEQTADLVSTYNIEANDGTEFSAFDVSIAMPEGQEFTEAGEFAVAVDLPVDEKAGDFKLYHIHEGQVEELPVEVVDGKVLFTTAGFSEFVLSYTVDFEYNGYTFSMPGGGVLLLSELFEQLGIEENVADVVDVTFTDYSLLKIEKLNAGDSYRLYIDTFEGFTEEELDAMEPNTVISADKTAIDRVVNTDNWLLTSLKPFDTPEQLTIVMDGGNQYLINVTDDMVINADGSVKMQSIATIRTSVSKKITQTEQERDASFDINMGVLLTKDGLQALQDAVRASTTDPKTIPAIVYDFSSIVTNSPIEGMISATTVDLKDDGDVVGTVTIDPSGKAIIQYNDPAWVTRKTAIAANIIVSVGTNETKIPNNNQYTWEFPDSNSVTIKYKKNYSTEAKKYELTGSPETGYTATYTAKFKSTSTMQSLTFTDTLGSDDLQKLNQSSITVTRDGQDVTSQWTKNSADDHGFEIVASNQPAGEYTVSYTTSITQAQYEAMQVGTESWENNSAKWNLNGSNEIPGGDTTFKIDKPKPPEPPATVTKSSDKEDQEVSRGGDINYTVRFESTKLNGLRINDKMTDVQILDPSSVVVKINGQTITTPSGFVNYNNDNNFSTWNMTDVFNYTFPEDGPYTEKTDGSKYTIEVTYKTTLIDQETAKANNIFDGVSVENVAEEGRYYEKDKTTSTVTFDKEVIHTVDKTAEALNVDVDGKWVPGTQVNYVIKVGDGTTDLADVHVVDKMTGLQKLNSGSVQISYGDDQHYSPLTTGIVYDDSQEYTANQVDVLDFALPQSAGYGPVYIKYSTTVMSQEDATRLGIYDPEAVNNDVNVGDKGHDGTSGTVPYLPEPKFPLTKEVDIAATEKEDSGATKLGGRVNYHLSFGDATIEDMSNVVIRDEMTDVQKLVGDVVVRLSQPLAADITLQDGTVVRAGEQSFVMPTSSSEGANDGVVWAAWLDDGKYSLDRNVRVFYYKLPEGVGKGPIYVDYAVDVIDEEEAKKAGINDTHNVYNTALSGNNSQTTEYPVDFPKNLPHTPYVEKEWEGWDMAKKAVKWKIIVDKTADSAYPIENVKITERLTNESNIQSPEINGGTYTIKSWEIDMVNAVLTTESGRTLVMGEDYEIYKGGLVNGSDTMPYFLIYNLTEKVIIHLSYATDLSIIQDYKATNKVTVEGGNESTVTKTYTSPEFTLSKTGEIVSTPDQPDLENHIVKWTVLINPTRVQVDEPESVTFSDLLPKGMTLVDGYKWQNDKEIDTTNPTIIVAYNQANYEYAVSTVPDADNYIAPVVISPSDRTKLKGVRYDITYYTYIDDAEWERITSSAGGAKTYDNTVTIKADGIIKNGETEVTIKSDEYIKKTDETKTGTYTGVDNKAHVDVVVDDEGNGTDYVSYKIEINPNAAALNRVDPVNPGDTVTYDPITLTDHISTNMDFDPSTLVIKKYGTPKDESTLTEVTAASEGLVVSYNDDSRLLAIAGLKDKTAYRIEYKNKVRAQGEDTFVNTATLTGGGSHSSTTSEKHKFENVTVESISYDMELDLRKIKETDITQYLPGVTFELWEVELAIDPSTLTDAQWEQLYIDTNNDEYSPWMLDSFKMVGKKKLDTVTTTEANKGVVRLPHKATGSETGIQINPLTVYYWIETENTNPDFKAENVPHYFVLYPDKKMAWVDEDGNIVDEDDKNAKKVVRVVLSDEEKAKHQRYAWALDNLFSEANKAIVASMSSGVTWSVNNLETKYTTISATKTWKGDADNLFETRPNDGIKLTLYQKLGDGEWVVYDPKNPENETPRVNQNPVIIRGSTYTTTENGKTVTKEDWPKANWLRLPAYKIEKVLNQESGKWDDVIVGYYTYKVVEDPVENYTTEYVAERKDENGEDIDLENDGVSGGIIDVTNTYIPPTTKIGVHKSFKVPEGTALPEQIIVHLMQIKTDKDGNVYDPVDYGITRMLTEQNDWSELFTGLPTRDGNGNTFTYTVVEDTDALEDDGFTYTQTEYVLDGVKDPTSGGLISGTVEINNHGPGSLKIEKNVTINSVPAEVGDSGADGTYTFHVMRKVNDELVEITDTYENGTPKSPVTITIENGASNYAMVTGLDAGDYYIHEDEPTNGTSLTGGNDVKVVVVGGVDDPDAVNVGSFTNNIDKTRVKVHKTWVNANRDAEGNIINGTNHEWPRGMTVQMELRKVQDGQAEHVKVDTPTWYSQNNKTWSDTIVLNAVRQFGVFDNLDELEDGWTYVVDETIIGDNPERFEAFIGEVDEDGNIEIVNAEKTQALFTKKWENTSNESGAGNYKRPNLKISFRLKQFYVNAAGEKVETAASVAQTGIFAPKTIAENTVLNETDGDVTITKEATTGAEWNVLWNNLPAEGEEAGTAVTYSYEVEELGVTASDTDVKADYDTTYSDDKLTVTNRYNKATSAAVEKAWSDDKAHNDVNVTMTLYKSYIAYDGTGSLFSATVSVDNWKDTNGNAGTAPTGADDKITVTIKKKSTDATVATFDLTADNSWTYETGDVLRKGTEYEVSWEAANGVKGAELLRAIDDQIKLTGVVAAKANTISVTDNSNNQRTTLSTTSSSVTLTLGYYTYGSPVNVDVTVDGRAKVSDAVVTEGTKNSNSYTTRVYTVTGISQNTIIHYEATNGHYVETVVLSEAASGGSNVSPTGSEDYILYSNADEQMPADGDLTEVGSVVLNKDDLAGVWSYEWGDLPLSDATSELYYYVKETAISDPSLVVGEPEVEYEFRDGEPRTITRVKITNIVKGGKLEVTKAATFDPTDNGANANKLYSFYVQDETGKYVQELGGSLGDRIKWFTLKSGETVTFPNLPAGKYTVKEDEKAAKVIGYDLAVSGEGDINVVKDGTATANLTNTYTEEKGSLKLAKTFTGLTYDQLTPEQKQALEKVYFTVKNASNETIAMIYLKVDESNMDADLTKTISNLKPGTYTVTEAIPNDSVPSGYEYKTTTVNVTGGTGTSGDKSATATVEANKTVTVTFDNEYDESTADLTVTKNLSKANTSGSDLTFYVGLFTDSQGTALATQTDVGGTNPKKVTVSQNQSAGTVTFTGLTIGTTYYVFETNASGVKVSTTDKVSGYAIKASDAVGKTVTIQPNNNAASITNDYSASGTAQLSAKKASNDTLGDRKFKFELLDGSGTVIQTSEEVEQGQTVTFTAFQYTYEDVTNSPFTYKIKEFIPADAETVGGKKVKDGVTYDEHVKTVVVTVSDNGNGTLDVKYDGSATFSTPEFTNSYEATGSATFSGTKSIVNRNFKEDDKFTVKVVGLDNAPMPGTTVAGAEYTKEFTLKAKNVASNATSFNYVLDAINYSLSDIPTGETSKIFTYTVTESAQTMDGVAAVDSTSYTVTVTISDNGNGTLNVVTSNNYNALNFTNTFDVNVKAQIEGMKLMAPNTESKAGYKFNLTPQGPAPTPESTDKPESNASGDFTFPEITYTMENAKAGNESPTGVWTNTYTYTVTEDVPSPDVTDDERTAGYAIREGVKYDLSEKQVTVTVTYNAATGEMTAVVNPEKIGIQFTNEQLGKLKLTKTLKATDPAGDTTKVFYFTITFNSADLAGKTYSTVVTETGKADVSGTVTPAAGENSTSVVTVTLNAGQTLEVKDLPIGVNYTITEEDDPDYKVSSNTNDVNQTISKDGVTTTFENERVLGKLTVTKNVQLNGVADSEANGKEFWVAVYSDAEATTKVAGPSKITVNNTGSGTVEFNNLPVGTYYVYELTAEDGTPITGNSGKINDVDYVVTTVNTDAVITKADTEGSATITNNKSEKGTLTVKKVTLYNLEPDDQVNGKKIKIGLYTDAGTTAVKDPTDNSKNYVKEIELGATGAGEVSFSELDYGTYYAYEIDDSGNPVTGNSATINQVVYTVSQDKTNVTLAHGTSQTGEITITNSTEEKGSLKVTKEIQVNGTAANLSGSFQVALYEVTTTTDNSGDSPVTTETETLVGEPQTITVTDGSSTTATFSDLTVGGKYRVYEVTVDENTDSDKVTKVGSQFGIYTVSYAEQEVTIPRGVDKDVTGTKVINNIETTSVKVDKKWFNGSDDITNSIANASITVKLTDGTGDVTADASGVTISPITLDGRTEATPWTYEWTNLPKYNASGAEITYEVVETSAKVETNKDGGTELLAVAQTADHDTDPTKANERHLVNTLPMVDINATKQWLDKDGNAILPANLPEGATVTFELFNNATATGNTVVLDGTTEEARIAADEAIVGDEAKAAALAALTKGEFTAWKAEWKNLPKYDDTGAEITYTIKETSGFTNFTNLDPNGVSSNGTIRNKKPEASATITASKNMATGETPTDEAYSFILTAASGTPMPENSTAVEADVEAGTEGYVQKTVTNIGTAVTFGSINYTLADMTGATPVDGEGNENKTEKTFTYTLKEVIPEGATAANSYTFNGVQYDPSEYTVTVKVTLDSANGTLTAADPSYKKGEEEATTTAPTFTNKEVKDFHFSKAWAGLVTEWPEGEEITVTLAKQLTNSSGTAISGEGTYVTVGNVTLNKDGKVTKEGEYEGTVTATTDGGVTTFTFPNLDKYGVVTIEGTPTKGEWVYEVKEVSFKSGKSYSVTYSAGTGITVAKDNETITNTEFGYELPSTGGPGTTGFYVLGSILTLLALVLLITKKRSDGAGIE